MDPISAMRMTVAGRIMPFNPPALNQVPKLGADELKKLGEISPSQLQGSSGVQLPGQTPLPPLSNVSGAKSFSDYLGEMVHDVNSKQAAAGNAVQGVLTGNDVPLHQAMLAVEEASVSFQLMVEVRNKLLESYQELMRMQI